MSRHARYVISRNFKSRPQNTANSCWVCTVQEPALSSTASLHVSADPNKNDQTLQDPQASHSTRSPSDQPTVCIDTPTVTLFGTHFVVTLQHSLCHSNSDPVWHTLCCYLHFNTVCTVTRTVTLFGTHFVVTLQHGLYCHSNSDTVWHTLCCYTSTRSVLSLKQWHCLAYNLLLLTLQHSLYWHSNSDPVWHTLCCY